MQENKLAIFEEKEIRREWYKEDWYFSVVDVIEALVENNKRPRKYWSDLKQKLILEGFVEVSEKIGQLKMLAKDGKMRLTDVADTKTLLRIIQTIPSPKAEPFKRWLAQVGSERLEEIVNPELAINRAKEIYIRKGYEDTWIAQRLKTIDNRKELTDTWKERGAKDRDYAILTDEIYKSTFNMNTAQYKELKGISRTKRNLRDSMGKLELAITNLAEVTANEMHNTNNSFGLEELRDDVQEAGKITGKARKEIEEKIGKKVAEKTNYNSLTKSNVKKLTSKKEEY
jgi:DNA-damage-inducible protein D